MKVFVTGGSGMIGSKFVEELSKRGDDVLYSYLSRDASIGFGKPVELDVTDRDAVISTITKFKPDLVIHCSALTKVDLCETDPNLADRINVQGTQNVVDACKKVNSKIIYISTSFVFDGSKEIFTEEDKTHAINQYGLTKLKGEDIVRKSGLPFMILRTDHPYRWSPLHAEKNNAMRLIGLFERKEKFREADDWFNTPTLVENLVDASLKLIDDWEDGIYHVVGSDYVSRYELAMTVADMVKGDKQLVEKVKSSVFNLPTKRPNVHMSNEKVQKKTGVKMLGVKDGMRIVLEQRGKVK
jgi:dTDP-4-dehydrorhamnose reductase